MVVGVLWASNSPLKTKLTFWLEANNKFLTWENLRKKGFQGPGLCPQCKSENESTSHLFGSCSFAGHVWNNATRTLTQTRLNIAVGSWVQRAKEWWGNEAVCNHSAFPTLFIYTIWETRNRAIFKDKWMPIDITTNILV